MSITPTADLDAAFGRAGGDRVGFVLSEDWVSVTLVGSLLIEHLWFGGNRANVSLCFALVQSGLLGATLTTSWGKAALDRLNGWTTAAALFGLVLAALTLTLRPLAFGGNPAWLHVGLAARAAINPIGVLTEIAKLFGYASVFTLTALIASSRRRSLMMMKILVIYALVFGLLALILEGLSPVDVFGWRKPGISQFRVSGLFSSANTAATVFGLNAILASGGLIRGASQIQEKSPIGVMVGLVKYFPLELVAFFINVGCLLLSGSRGGIAAFTLSFAVLLVWRGFLDRGGASRFARILLGSIAAVLVLVSGGLALNRYLHAAFISDLRPTWAVLTWTLFTFAPLQGFGPGSLATVFQSLTSPANFGVVNWAGSAHNVYLQWLAEAGILGSIPMAGLLFWVIGRSLVDIREHGASAVWRPTLFACTLMVAIHSLVEYSLQEPSISVFWSLVLGASLGFASQKRGKKRRRSAANGPSEL